MSTSKSRKKSPDVWHTPLIKLGLPSQLEEKLEAAKDLLPEENSAPEQKRPISGKKATVEDLIFSLEIRDGRFQSCWKILSILDIAAISQALRSRKMNLMELFERRSVRTIK